MNVLSLTLGVPHGQISETMSESEPTCYACESEPIALVHKGSQGPLPMCRNHLEKANEIGLVDDSEKPANTNN